LSYNMRSKWGAQSNTPGVRLTARLMINTGSNEPSVG
jgi:hypothetical protein